MRVIIELFQNKGEYFHKILESENFAIELEVIYQM